MADPKKNKDLNKELEKQIEHYSSIEELLRKISAHNDDQYKIHKDINDQLTEIDELTEQAQERWEEIEKTGDKFEKGISDKLLKSTGHILQVSTGTADAARNYSDTIAGTIDHLNTALEQNKGNHLATAMINKEMEKYNDKLEMAREASNVQLLIAEQIKNANEAIADQAGNILDGTYQQVDTHKILNSIKYDELKLDELREEKADALANKDADRVKLLGELIKQKEESISRDKVAVSNIEAQNKQWSAASNVISDMGSGVTAIGNKISGAFEKVPGGAHIAKMLNIEGLAGNIQKKLGNALANVFQMGGKQAVAMGKLATASLGILGAIAGFMLHTLMHIDAEVSELGKEFGISRKEAMGLHHAAIAISDDMQIIGVNSEKVAKNVMNVSQAMGGIDIAHQLHEGNEAAAELVRNTTVLTEKFGLSAEEVKAIHDVSTMTGKSMGELTMEAQTLGEGIFTAKENLKTLASIPKSVTVAFKGSTQELIKAAQKAKMLGMELGKMQDIGDGMLDIEQSLGKEMEARALTGKNLQLDAARMYALQGDTAKLQDELLKQAGSLEDFQKMNRIQQKAFADAMGMSVDEMAGMLTNAQKLKDIGMSTAQAEKLQAKNAQELRKIAEQTGDAEKKRYIEKLAKEKESAAAQERFSNIISKLQEKLQYLIGPILEVVHSLLDSVTAGDDLNNMMEGVKGVAVNLAAILKFIIPIITGIVGKVAGLFSLFGGVSDKTEEVQGGIEGVKKPIEAVHSSFGGILGVLGGISGFFFGKKAISKGLDIVKNKALDVGQTLMKKVTGPIGKMTDKLFAGKGGADKTSKVKTPKGGKAKGGFGDKIADFVNKVDAKKLIMSAAAILILAAALWVAAKAFQEFGKTDWEGIAKGVVGLLALVGVAFLIDKIKGQIIAGSVALLIMSAALVVMAIGFEKFGNMDWAAIGKGVVAIIAVAGVAVLLGMVAPLAIAGAAALIMLGGAVVLFGTGMYIFAAAVEKVQPLIEGLFSQFTKLLSLDPTKLPLIAAGIVAIAAALGTLALAAGAGGVAAGVGSAVAGLFGSEGPMEMVMNISKKLEPKKLSDTATAIRSLADAFKYFAEETAKLADFDVDKLDTIIDKMEDVRDAQSGGIGGAIMGAAKGIGSFLGNIFGQETTSVENKPMSVTDGGQAPSNDGDKLDKVISLLSQIAGAADQPTVIKFGDKTVEEIKGQLGFKKAYNIKVDNTFGRSVS